LGGWISLLFACSTSYYTKEQGRRDYFGIRRHILALGLTHSLRYLGCMEDGFWVLASCLQLVFLGRVSYCFLFCCPSSRVLFLRGDLDYSINHCSSILRSCLRPCAALVCSGDCLCSIGGVTRPLTRVCYHAWFYTHFEASLPGADAVSKGFLCQFLCSH